MSRPKPSRFQTGKSERNWTDELLGFPLQEAAPADLYLSSLYIHPRYQRRGHGMRLVQWGQDFIRSQDLKDMQLTALEAGVSLYRHMGFISLSGVYDTPSVDMRWSVDGHMTEEDTGYSDDEPERYW